jgi:tetratricopeptide (TPR) repeat protein
MGPARDLALLAILLAACGGRGGARDEPPGLARAEAALEAGLPGEARRGLAAIPPGSFATPEMRLRAARAFGKARDWAAAARILEGDAGDFRRANEAALLRVEALLRAGALEPAEKALGVLGTVGVRPPRAAVLHAMATVARGRTGDGARDLEPLVRAGTRDPDARVLWAQIVLDLPGEAERRLQEGMGAVGDRGPLLRALGRLLLRTGDADRAAHALVEAVRLRPWDRDARLDLARARVGTGRPEEMEAALEDLRRLARDDPEDFTIALALSEASAEKALRVSRAAGDSPSAANPEFEEALRLYEDLASRPAPDAGAAVSALFGLARLLVETIPLEHPSTSLLPGSRLRRAEAILDRALALDPDGRMVDGYGVRLVAENYYLRGRGYKRAHAGDRDHRDAVGWYEKALKADGRHLDATLDLALLYYDFLRTPEFVRKAARLVDAHERERSLRGLPPLRPDQLKPVAHIRRLAAEGKGFEAGTVTPDPSEGGKDAPPPPRGGLPGEAPPPDAPK